MHKDKRNRIFFSLLITLGLVFVCGCGRVSEKKRNQVLAQDPEFKYDLLLKEEADNQVKILKEDLARRKKEANSRIIDIKEQLRITERDTKVKIKEYQDRVLERRKRISNQIDSWNKDLKDCKAELKRVARDIKSIQTITKSKNLGNIVDDQDRLRTKLIEFTEKKKTLKDKISLIKHRIKLYKTELKLLR